tara:strand:- start:318 stop:605 length:288 start_codon:yes stop_codon:yes gene_type:complete
MGRSNNGDLNHNNNDSKMMKYPRIVGWSVVIGLWSITGCALECMKNKEVVDVVETAKDLIEWIEWDIENGYVDSTRGDTYLYHLQEIIINLEVTR